MGTQRTEQLETGYIENKPKAWKVSTKKNSMCAVFYLGRGDMKPKLHELWSIHIKIGRFTLFIGFGTVIVKSEPPQI